MTGKPRTPSDEQPLEPPRPKQQMQDDGSGDGAENFGNIDSESSQFGNIEPE